MNMTIAETVFARAFQSEHDSIYVAEIGLEVEREQEYELEATTYIYEDGSKIIDCNGELRVVE